jgi:2-methylcitrate dehydratase PrpD
MMARMTLAEHLSAFAARLSFEDVPPSVVASVRLRVLDLIGLALAATGQDFAAGLGHMLDGWGGGPAGCTVVGGKLAVPAPLAVLANGTLAHGLDFDDTHAASITHASAVVLPVVLAVGESEAIDGRRTVTAAVTGYEAIARLGMAAPGAFHARGWHATAACGPFAAALAAGKLLELGPPQLTAALGLAGSFASGVQEFLADGSWSKRVHPGWAGHGGLIAATLARGGFSGPATILEGRFGFYSTFLGAAPDARVFATLGREWETLRIGFKPYPCCHYLHAFVDCALNLRQTHRLRPDSIETVECRVAAQEVPIVCEPRVVKLRPRTPYDAKFSLPYAVAAALLDGRVGIETFEAERLADERLSDLAARVTSTIDPDSRFPEGFPGWIRLRLRDGRVLEAREPDGRGGPARPLTPQAIVDKFRDNASRTLPASRVGEIERTALALDTLDDVGALMRLCRA